jgi:predicted Zn-dependent protease
MSLAIIRDGEIESFIQKLSQPLIKAANLESKNIKFYIINDPTINAFVAGGQNIFLNSGLITKYYDPDILRGVIAHEIAHIASGHLARGNEEIEKATNLMMLSYLAGIVSAAASGSDAGYAMLMAGNQIAERFFLKYNRSQEEAADILALEYLKKTNNSPLGLLKILQFFKSQMLGNKIIDEYALTHPISQKRIDFIKANLKNFPINIYHKMLKKEDFQMQRIVAKLQGFLDNIETSLKATKGKNDFSSLYQRSIALFRSGQIAQSLKIIEKLLLDNPNDAYLLELQGQILYESGDLKNSIISYQKSLKLNKNNNLAKIIFAKAILDLDSDNLELINLAIKNLKEILFTEKDNLKIYKILSNAYKKLGDDANYNLILAEYYFIQKEYDEAKKYAKKSQKLFPDDDVKSLRILDILELSKSDDG